MAKHLQASHAIRDDINLISFRGEKLLQTPLQSVIGVYDQNSIQRGGGDSDIGWITVAAEVVVTASLFAFCH